MSTVAWLAPIDGGLVLRVRVQPRARRPGIGGVIGDRLRIRVSAPPSDGRANAEATALVAELSGVPRSSVTVAHGDTSRDKTLRVITTAPALASARLLARVSACADGAQSLK